MEVSNVSGNYFSGFQEVYHFKNNGTITNVVAMLKVFSYFTVVIPLAFALIHGSTSLYCRVSKIEDHSAIEIVVDNLARTTLSPTVDLSAVLNTYAPQFRPQVNLENLLAYSQSGDYKRHAQTARAYYNGHQLTEKDALQIVFQREPTNVAMGVNQYNEESLQQLFGYRKSVYNDREAKKADGSLFKDLPNTVAIYSETYLWPTPGKEIKKEIACLSLPAPALDSALQPHYAYYIHDGKLDATKYQEEITFLFKIIERAVRDHKDSAFDNKGIKRLVLSRFGQGFFLETLSSKDRKIAKNAYKSQLALFLERLKDLELTIVMSEYSSPRKDIWHPEMIIGDILKTAEERDLIINPWDPHSAPGNGNDGDRSFDGAMGTGSAILLTQTSWLNDTLKTPASLHAIL